MSGHYNLEKDAESKDVEQKLVEKMKEANGPNDIVEFEDVLRRIGEWGFAQTSQLMMLACVVFACAFHNMGMVFFGAFPDHHCHVPAATNATSVAERSFAYNASLPSVLRNGVSRHSECDVYIGGRNGTQPEIGECADVVGRWDYDRDVFTNTIVSEWDLVCDSKWMIAFAQMIYFLGFFVGCLVVGDLSDRYGRRPMIAICSSIQLVFGISTYFAPSYPVFVSLRFVLGFGTGGQRNSAYVLGQEWCTEDMRIIVDIMCETCWAIGCMILGGMAYGIRDWRTLELASSIPMIIYVLYYWLLMPSPRWLLTKGRPQEALEVLKKAAKRNGRPLPDDFDLSNITFEKEISTSLLDPLRTQNMRKTTLIVWLNWFVVGMVFFGLSYNIGNLVGDFYINHQIISFLGITAMVPLYFILKYYGRRWPISLSMIGAGVSCLVVMLLPGGELTWVTTVMACIGKSFADLVFGVVYIYTSEVYPTCIRTIGLGTGSMCARVGGMVSPYVVLLSDINHAIPYVIFGTCALITGMLSLYLPETHKRPLVDTVEEAERVNRLFCRCKEPEQPVIAVAVRGSDTSADESSEGGSQDMQV